jgi:hypothetical protein
MARFLSRNVAFPNAIDDTIHAELAGTTADGNFNLKKTCWQHVGITTPHLRTTDSQNYPLFAGSTGGAVVGAAAGVAAGVVAGTAAGVAAGVVAGVAAGVASGTAVGAAAEAGPSVVAGTAVVGALDGAVGVAVASAGVVSPAAPVANLSLSGGL